MELTWLDAVDQAALVRDGEVSALELVDAAIGRIETVNPRINAVIHERFGQARAEASGSLPDGPFRGVPLLLKDLNCHSAGDPLHNGSRAMKESGWRSDHDSAFVARLRRAGFVVVGRTNVPEFGASSSTEPQAYGPTGNPWNPTHSPGGSSGGSAAAVAAGMVPVAHGNDGGGSIRIPASACGVVGLKPTRARVSQAPDIGDAWGVGATIDGALTRTVRDTASTLDCMAGPEPGDPYAAPRLPGPLAEEVGVDPGRLRIGVLDRPAGDVPGDPDAAAAVEAAGALLARLGHELEASHPKAMGDVAFLGHLFDLMAVAVATDVRISSERIGRHLTDDELEPGNAALAAHARALSASEYASSVDWMQGFQRRMAGWWEDGFDVLLTPVLNGPPPPLGWLVDPGQGRTRAVALWQYTAQFNVTGQPAISLPLHWTSEGLPIGIQLVAAYGREDLLIRLAAQIEQAAPWADRYPPIHA